MSPWTRTALDEVVADIYRATTEPVLWTSVLERIGRRLDGTIATLHVHSHPAGIEPVTTIGAWGAEAPPDLRKYESFYATRNIWIERGAHLLQAGAILTLAEICPDEILLRSEYYLDLLRPLGVRHAILAVLLSDPDPNAYLSVGRPDGARPFGDEQRRLLGAVMPHLTQALRIQARIEIFQAGRHAVSGALERISLAVIFLDKQCRVVEMNSSARRIIQAGDGLRIERGVLFAVDTRTEVQLQQMIFGAAAVDSGRFLLHGGALSIPRSQGRRPLSAMVAPTGVTGFFPASRAARAVVLVEEPLTREAAPLDEFADAHRLSKAEAALVARLVDGTPLGKAAKDLGITGNTVRTHLKHVFAKTGARRQADLVRRALTYVAAKDRSPP